MMRRGPGLRALACNCRTGQKSMGRYYRLRRGLRGLGDDFTDSIDAGGGGSFDPSFDFSNIDFGSPTGSIVGDSGGYFPPTADQLGGGFDFSQLFNSSGGVIDPGQAGGGSNATFDPSVFLTEVGLNPDTSAPTVDPWQILYDVVESGTTGPNTNIGVAQQIGAGIQAGWDAALAQIQATLAQGKASASGGGASGGGSAGGGGAKPGSQQQQQPQQASVIGDLSTLLTRVLFTVGGYPVTIGMLGGGAVGIALLTAVASSGSSGGRRR